MRTYSGHPVRFDAPDLTPLSWTDLAVQLHRLCRYQGTRSFSVLQHLTLGTLIADQSALSPWLRGHFAAHDLAEFLLGDLHPDLKRMLPQYDEIHSDWLASIHRRLGLCWPMPRVLELAVEALDRRCLVVEMTGLSHPCLGEAEAENGGPATLDEKRAWAVALSLQVRDRRVPEDLSASNVAYRQAVLQSAVESVGGRDVRLGLDGITNSYLRLVTEFPRLRRTVAGDPIPLPDELAGALPAVGVGGAR